jgi:hypothetical protein
MLTTCHLQTKDFLAEKDTKIMPFLSFGLLTLDVELGRQ